MSDDLVKRLWQLDMHPESAPRQAADRIEELEARAEKAEAERHAAIAALSEEGRRRGEAEAKRDALRKALGQILTLDRGIPPEVTDSALDAWWSNLCAQYREIARAALNREPDT